MSDYPKRPEAVSLTVRIPLQDLVCFRTSGICPSSFAGAVASALDRLCSDEEYEALLFRQHAEWIRACERADDQRRESERAQRALGQEE